MVFRLGGGGGNGSVALYASDALERCEINVLDCIYDALRPRSRTRCVSVAIVMNQVRVGL